MPALSLKQKVAPTLKHKGAQKVAHRSSSVRGSAAGTKIHQLLDGRIVQLRELDAREQAFLRDVQKMARQGVNYFEVYRVATGPGSLALQGRNRIDRNIVESPLYLVARDIATRVGIQQGLILPPEHPQKRTEAPKDASMFSAPQPPDLIGFPRAPVYKPTPRDPLKPVPSHHS